MIVIMPPLTMTNRSAPVARGKFQAWTYPLSTFLLATGFLFTLVMVVTRSAANWPETLLLLLAAVSTLVAATRQLPLQNVLLAAFIIAIVGGVAHTIGARGGIPFGPFMFGSEAGHKLFGTLPWALPLLWLVMVLNSRGVGRLVLRPWRKTRTYGFWLIGLTALLTMLLDCALEPFATHVKHYWIWTSTGFPLTPQNGPISNSVGWFVVTLLMLAFVTPVLINKQLSKRSRPDFHPLAVWLGAILISGLAVALHGFWLAAAVDAVIGGVVTGFAVRGARW